MTAAQRHLPPILDRFRAEHPVEIKLTTGDAADAMEKVNGRSGPGNRRQTRNAARRGGVSMPENLAVVLIRRCPARCVIRFRLISPTGRQVPFIMADQGPVRRRIELWFRRHKISNCGDFTPPSAVTVLCLTGGALRRHCCRKWC